MKYPLLTLGCVLVSAAILLAQPPSVAHRTPTALRQVPRLPIAPPVVDICGCNIGEPCICLAGFCECVKCQCDPPVCRGAVIVTRKPLSYSQGVDEARRWSAPLIVWVGQDPDDSLEPDAIHCRWDQFPGVTGPAVVVSGWYQGRLSRFGVLRGMPTAKQITETIDLWPDKSTKTPGSSSSASWGSGSPLAPALRFAPAFSFPEFSVGTRRGGGIRSC